jgi:hypothetical protein
LNRQPPAATHLSQSSNVISLRLIAKGSANVTRRTGRSKGVAAAPMSEEPEGMTTSSGQSGQSWRLSPGRKGAPGCTLGPKPLPDEAPEQVLARLMAEAGSGLAGGMMREVVAEPARLRPVAR